MFSILKKIFGSTTDYKGLVSNGAIILDVRSEGEFRSGHVRGATNIPLEQVLKYIMAAHGMHYSKKFNKLCGR